VKEYITIAEIMIILGYGLIVACATLIDYKIGLGTAGTLLFVLGLALARAQARNEAEKVNTDGPS
jgi:hypothetical protein